MEMDWYPEVDVEMEDVTDWYLDVVMEEGFPLAKDADYRYPYVWNSRQDSFSLRSISRYCHATPSHQNTSSLPVVPHKVRKASPPPEEDEDDPFRDLGPSQVDIFQDREYIEPHKRGKRRD